MSEYLHLGRWGKIKVSVHWTALVSVAWLFIVFTDVLSTLIAAVALFLLMLAHEFGHIAVARMRGLSSYGVVLMGIHGETFRAQQGTHLDRVLIAWGGVLAQFLILLLAWIGPQFIPLETSIWLMPVLAPLIYICIKWNMFLMVVALLPMGPMDGHLAWQILPMLNKFFKSNMPAPKPAKPSPNKQGNVIDLNAHRRKD